MLSRIQNRFRNCLVFPALVVTLTLSAAPARANAVDDWAAIAYQVVIVNAGSAGVGHIDFAYGPVALGESQLTVLLYRPRTTDRRSA